MTPPLVRPKMNGYCQWIWTCPYCPKSAGIFRFCTIGRTFVDALRLGRDHIQAEHKERGAQ